MADKIIHIPVGSGYLFHDVFSGKIPENADIETEAHRLGYIQKGGEIDYKPTFKTFKDDFGEIQRSKLTAEEATFKASLIAWSASDFNTFVSTARITETQGHRTIKIGGRGMTTGKCIFSALSIPMQNTAMYELPLWARRPAGSS